MLLRFTKMHGAGNDFVFLNALAQKLPDDLPTFSKRICHRQFGIGADQVLIVHPSKTHDFRMEIYNADGGLVEMCGNGVRCFAKYVRDKGLTDKDEIRVETPAGTIVPRVIAGHPRETSDTSWVRVDMGEPVLEGEKIPTAGTGRIVARPFYIESTQLSSGDPDKVIMTCVSMGNPHAVIFVKGLDDYPVEKIGRLIECHPFFPRRTNVEFVEIADRTHLRQRTWERGSGETLACGTGASAVCAAAVLNGLAERRVTVSLKGGDLELEWDEKSGHVYKTGPATHVFEGELDASAAVPVAASAALTASNAPENVTGGYLNQFKDQLSRLKK